MGLLGSIGLVSFKGLVKTMARNLRLHSLFASVYVMALIAICYPQWETAGTTAAKLGVAIPAILLVLIPWVGLALRDEARKSGQVEMLSNSDERNRARSVEWILKSAHRRRDKKLPDVIVVCKSGTNWRGEFDTNNATKTAKVLGRSKISIGFLFTGATSGVDRAAMTLSNEASDQGMLEKKQKECCDVLRDFIAGHPKAGARIEVRRLPLAMLDSFCLYDPGYPHNQSINVDIPTKHQETGYPVLCVENTGPQRLLFSALRRRIAFLWEKGTAVIPPKSSLKTVKMMASSVKDYVVDSEQ